MKIKNILAQTLIEDITLHKVKVQIMIHAAELPNRHKVFINLGKYEDHRDKIRVQKPQVGLNYNRK